MPQSGFRRRRGIARRPFRCPCSARSRLPASTARCAVTRIVHAGDNGRVWLEPCLVDDCGDSEEHDQDDAGARQAAQGLFALRGNVFIEVPPPAIACGSARVAQGGDAALLPEQSQDEPGLALQDQLNRVETRILGAQIDIVRAQGRMQGSHVVKHAQEGEGVVRRGALHAAEPAISLLDQAAQFVKGAVCFE